METVAVVGGGLAGSEAAWQLASHGIRVHLFEMRPATSTPAHVTGELAEIVCSNSLGSDESGTGAALLKEELRALGSLLLQIADSVRVPAGKALAVDRALFGKKATEIITTHPLIEVHREEMKELPASPAIVATGPLTSDAMASQVQEFTGKQNLHFYDASSPIVLGESISLEKVFRASRYNRGNDYLNCPLNRDEYIAFREALLGGELASVRDFDKINFFEGCLPVEELAVRGEDTMRFGPLKPVGLVDPLTGRQPYAVVQLRQDDLAGEHFNIVGFQSRLTWGEQKRIFSMIPGLEHAEYVSHGKVHRNTYINAPACLGQMFESLKRPALFIAGTLAGVEGYTECIASGLLSARCLIARIENRPFDPPPSTTAIGALSRYLQQADWKHFQPANFSFGLLDSLVKQIRAKDARRQALVERARSDFAAWMPNP